MQFGYNDNKRNTYIVYLICLPKTLNSIRYPLKLSQVSSGIKNVVSQR